MFAVAKPFNSVNRRFFEGDPVVASDIEPGSAMNFADLKDAGFIIAAKVNYEAMTKAELEALAADHHVDISQAKTKADVIAELVYADKVEEAVQTANYDGFLKGELERLAMSRRIDISQAHTKAELIGLLESVPVVVAAAAVERQSLPPSVP